jgi:hypothetical protein
MTSFYEREHGHSNTISVSVKDEKFLDLNKHYFIKTFNTYLNSKNQVVFILATFFGTKVPSEIFSVANKNIK